jgi:predicted RNase H-like HicB family nuclease
MSEQEIEYVVRVHEEPDGSLWAEVVDLPGCFASGDTLDELRDAVGEAIRLYRSDDAVSSEAATRDAVPLQVGEIRVKVRA